MSDPQYRYSELVRRIRDVMRTEWDPIGVGHCPEAVHEYDGYVQEVLDLLKAGSPVEEIYAFLWWAETVHMTLPGDAEKTMAIAKRLHDVGAEHLHYNDPPQGI